jgi:hypothetical protein
MSAAFFRFESSNNSAAPLWLRALAIARAAFNAHHGFKAVPPSPK